MCIRDRYQSDNNKNSHQQQIKKAINNKNYNQSHENNDIDDDNDYNSNIFITNPPRKQLNEHQYFSENDQIKLKHNQNTSFENVPHIDQNIQRKYIPSKYSISQTSSPKSKLQKKFVINITNDETFTNRFYKVFQENNEEEETTEELLKENCLLRNKLKEINQIVTDKIEKNKQSIVSTMAAKVTPQKSQHDQSEILQAEISNNTLILSRMQKEHVKQQQRVEQICQVKYLSNIEQEIQFIKSSIRDQIKELKVLYSDQCKIGKEHKSLQDADYFSPKLKKYREDLVLAQNLINENKKLKQNLDNVVNRMKNCQEKKSRHQELIQKIKG
eukprot:TRINITY_DN31419_c0_g1_i2.p3 TRINITY_DN31419_c0_g1~~TRINITY_DN31419_c0_g1_i2.p3  ORF type:complete len:329 (+),score=68.65 TRINITY_DN31419_c0_g1_i2:178-1164(+)